jgi:hypothetical protein
VPPRDKETKNKVRKMEVQITIIMDNYKNYKLIVLNV